MQLAAGVVVQRKYRLVRLLGEGGMGVIWQARHDMLSTDIALKFLHAELACRPHIVARFMQEARVSAGIKSPYVVTVTDVDQTDENVPFLVMELLTGEVLADRLAREPVLPVAFAAEILVQVLLALEAAHAAGVIHRDMKPENVFLTKSSGVFGANSSGLLAKVLDFGIAKLRAIGEVQAHLTRPGSVMGTPEYMAPEQAFAADSVDARADVYAVGAMAFEMLSGRRPIPGQDPRSIATEALQSGSPRLIDVAPNVPPNVSDVVATALNPNPAHRFSSVTALRQALLNACIEANIRLDLPPLPPPRDSGNVGTRAAIAPGAPAAPVHSVASNASVGAPEPTIIEMPSPIAPTNMAVVAASGDALPTTNHNQPAFQGASEYSSIVPVLPPTPLDNASYGPRDIGAHASGGQPPAGNVPAFASQGGVPAIGAHDDESLGDKRPYPWAMVAIAAGAVVVVVAAIVLFAQGTFDFAFRSSPPTSASSGEPKKVHPAPSASDSVQTEASASVSTPASTSASASSSRAVTTRSTVSVPTRSTATTRPKTATTSGSSDVITIPLPTWPPVFSQ
jgi:serine/threonine-protein kinase